MASILSLPDDCLHKIVSFIEDPSSFKSITLTCQRFLQVTKNAKSDLHSNLLRAKAEYLIKCCIVRRRRARFPHHRSALDCRRADYDGDDLVTLLRGCAHLTTEKNTLTYDKVVDVWQRNGPVAAKLFTWVRSLKSHSGNGGSVMETTRFSESCGITIHLPSCERSLVIQTSYFEDYSHENVPFLRIQISCGDLTVKSEGFSRWSRKCAVEPMKAVVELLQKELGETVPPITDDFFLWLCCFFPDKANLTEGNRLRFKDDTRNTKPIHASVQTAIAEFHKELQFGGNLEKLLLIWSNKTLEKYEWLQSKYPKMIKETIRQISKRSETKILERLGEDASRFYRIVNCHDLKELPNKVLLDLFLRTSLEASTFKPATIANKNVESRVFFKCLGSKVMKVCGSIHGDGKSIPTWETLQLEFTLPDGKVLKLDAPLDLETLSPIRDLLQECFNSTMQGKQTRIDNLRAAVYFLHALELSSASDITSNRMIPLQRFPESEEEPDDWEYKNYCSLQRFPESEEEPDDWEYNDYSSSPEYGKYDYFFNK